MLTPVLPAAILSVCSQVLPAAILIVFYIVLPAAILTMDMLNSSVILIAFFTILLAIFLTACSLVMSDAILITVLPAGSITVKGTLA